MDGLRRIWQGQSLQAQHPHMVPLEFELPRDFVVQATTRAYLKVGFDFGCNRVASPRMETRFLFCISMGATSSNR